MKHLFKMIALILGIGQSTAQPMINKQTTTEHFYINNQKVSKEAFFAYKQKPVVTTPRSLKSNVLTTKQFVTMMAITKNIICL